MDYRIVAAVVVSGALALVPGTTHAADGAVCYSGLFTQTVSAGFGTTTFPQLANHHKFNCGWAATYTIKELSQAGWIIVSTQPTAYSTTINSDGSGSTKTRVMLVIQK